MWERKYFVIQKMKNKACIDKSQRVYPGETGYDELEKLFPTVKNPLKEIGRDVAMAVKNMAA